ncbi:hypothetical protein DRW07_07865 [Alteromonas sediminis]|uniref:Rap1a immunity protein domain-containing protein n=1 Tax=Alteromonas sediminis TaxID=2259342 RepID=A0A3N5ZC76_9ALTE|nr:hypothetical protein [Alteromonas sediminis]RPJ67428.1 hypothetical protein DRW07_07865 [Alteromonas sediminis]
MIKRFRLLTLFFSFLAMQSHAAGIGINDILKGMENNPAMHDDFKIVISGIALGLMAANMKAEKNGVKIWCLSDSQEGSVSTNSETLFRKMLEVKGDKYQQNNTHLAIIMLDAFDYHYGCKR